MIIGVRLSKEVCVVYVLVNVFFDCNMILEFLLLLVKWSFS